MRKQNFNLFIIFTLLLASCSELQQNSKEVISSTINAESDTDKKFIKEISYANTAEVEFGKGALAKATNKKIKEYGRRMVEEHTKAQKELRQLAKTKNIAIPDTLDAEHMELRKKTSNQTSTEFEKNYIQSQIDDHKKVLKLFNTEIESGKDKDVVNYAKKYVHHIEMHLDEATRIQESMLVKQ